MADTTFNYIDSLSSSANLQFMSDQLDQAIQTTGRKTFIFLLDKKDTELSPVYQEETHGRVYLPHFEQRALYKTNSFVSSLNAQNYVETENNLELEFNFARMVQNIHELKQATSGKLIIKNTSRVPLEIEINNFDSFTIKNNIETLYSKKLEGTIFSFVSAVNSETNLVKLTYSGDGDTLEFLSRTSFKLLPRREREIVLNNSIYKNAGDVISRGDVIVNDRSKLYQVVGAYPTDDSYGAYISWTVQAELMNIAKADGLPNDYTELLKHNQYNLTAKYNLS